MTRETMDGPTTRRGFLKAGAGAVAATTMPETTLAYEQDDEEVTVVIKRVEFGVPHVYARDANGKVPVFYGYGYAVAEDRLFQLEMYRRFYHGTLAEVLGSEWIDFDREARINRSGSHLEQQIDTHLEDTHRDILDAFADGINEYITTVESGEREFHKGFVDNDFTPEQWTRKDVAGSFLATLSALSNTQLETFGAFLLSQLKGRYDEETAMELFSDIQWGNDPGAPTSTAPANDGYTPPYTPAGDDAENEEESEDDDGEEKTSESRSVIDDGTNISSGEYRLPADPEAAHESALEHRQILAKGLNALGLPIKLGSYGLAVSSEYTESGDALLFGGPQLGFASPSEMYEVGLHGPDFDVVGATVPAWPFVVWGHNRNGAMTGTAGLDNTIQTFVETIREAPDDDGYEYKFQGSWYPVKATTETIPVKGSDDATVTVRRTRHGVVISWSPDRGEAVTMTRSYEGRDMNDLVASLDQQFARNIHEFEDAYLRLNYSLNGLWAGETGDIGFFHGGRYPDWENVDWDTRLPADGTKYELTDEDYVQAADVEDLSAINPSRGYTASWNNKPAPGWDNGDLSLFWGSDSRVQRLINLVDHRLEEEEAISYEFMKEIVHDLAFVDLSAIRYKEPLLAALEDADLSETEQAAAQALEAWNNYRQGAGADNLGPYPVGFIVFDEFFSRLLEHTFGPAFGPVFRIGETPFFRQGQTQSGSHLLMRTLHPDKAALPPARDYFQGNRDGVFRSAFEAAVTNLSDQFDTDDVSQWQADARVEELDNLSFYNLPIGVGDAGDMPFLNRGTENHFVQSGGDEQGGGPGFRAENIVPPGNSGYIAPDGTKDKHYADQLQKFIAFEYKQLRFSDEEVARGLESVTTLRRDR